MKRSLVFGIVAMILASCSVQEADVLLDESPVFYATLEQPDGMDTKVYANEQLLIRWHEDDRVSIFNHSSYNHQYMFTGSTGDNGGGFTEVNGDEFYTGNSIPDIVSVYPYQASNSIDESEVLYLSLPSEQYYAPDSFGRGANTMVSVSSGNFLQFKNVGGYLMFSLYGEGVMVSSLTLRGNNGETLAGHAYVTMPLNGIPSVEMADGSDSITLNCDPPVALGATESESVQFWFVVPPITFSHGFTFTVNQSSGDIFEKCTDKSITISRSKLAKMAPMGVKPDIPITEPEAVDLGLPSGTLWASHNLGASCPSDIGGRFAWGETAVKSDYQWSNYKWCNGSSNSITKYCNNSSYGIVDGKTKLDMEDDAVYVLLGGEWHMPDNAQIEELIDKCSWTSESLDGISGYKVTGPNGKAVFFPCNGQWDDYGITYNSRVYIWSSECYGTSNAYRLQYPNDSDWGYNHRHDGLCLRPVKGYSGQSNYDGIQVEAVDLGLPSGIKWAPFNVGATSPEEFGDHFAWGETSPKNEYTWDNYKFCVSVSSWYDVTFNKYCPSYQEEYWGGSGSPDNKTSFKDYSYADDAARANWHGDWRTPSYAEWTELRNNCSWVWKENYKGTGINGYLVTGPSSKSIFLPAAGYRQDTGLAYAGSAGSYWSSSLVTDYWPIFARFVIFISGEVHQNNINYRFLGQSVRPVLGDEVTVSSVQLDQTTLSLKVGETATLTATILPENAPDKSVTWSSSDISVAAVDDSGLVTASKAGTATITVTTNEDGYSATCNVSVVEQ